MLSDEPGNGLQWSSIASLSRDVLTCTRCTLSETRTNAVPGEGSDFPGILFIGEGPGANEDQQGRPFVGRAGALLDELLAAVPLRREDVYITNVVKCRPPENRDPLPDEVRACWPYLESQIQLLKPRVIATLGRHSLMRFFPDARISSAHGQTMKWRDGIVVFPLYHPAAGLRSTKLKTALQEDILKLPQAMIAALESDRLKDDQPGSQPSEAASPIEQSADPAKGQIGLFD
ncbi:MAG: uracil-DNA glycosylase [Chloroflexi bacterium]|nr:uracil-DNA glycosylase [Chloroflexota bacterium]